MAADAAARAYVQQQFTGKRFGRGVCSLPCDGLFEAFSMTANKRCMWRLTLVRGPLQAPVALSWLFSLSCLCFTNSPLLPLPSCHPWRQGHGILGSRECLLNSAFIQASTSKVCSVLDILLSRLSSLLQLCCCLCMSPCAAPSSASTKPQLSAVLRKRTKDEKRLVKSAEVKAV